MIGNFNTMIMVIICSPIKNVVLFDDKITVVSSKQDFLNNSSIICFTKSK